MAAIAHAFLEQRVQVMFRVVSGLLDWLRAGFQHENRDEKDEAFQNRFNEVLNISVLLLDDMGTEHDTPWVHEKLFQIINHRYMHQLPTVMSTNLDLRDFDPRIQSRLCDQRLSEMIATTTQDYRERPERRQQRPHKQTGRERA